MNPLKVAWKLYWQAEANCPRRTFLITVAVGIAIIMGIVFWASSCYERSHTQITLSTMVRIGEGEWQKAECSTWVEDRSHDMEVWGVTVEEKR